MTLVSLVFKDILKDNLFLYAIFSTKIMCLDLLRNQWEKYIKTRLPGLLGYQGASRPCCYFNFWLLLNLSAIIILWNNNNTIVADLQFFFVDFENFTKIFFLLKTYIVTLSIQKTTLGLGVMWGPTQSLGRIAVK